jgi:hypothetical protein
LWESRPLPWALWVPRATLTLVAPLPATRPAMQLELAGSA